MAVKVNIAQAKSKLSHYVSLVERGETVVLCRHNKPVAEIRPVATEDNQPRVFGLWKGRFELGREFFEPLPEDILKAFWGESGEGPR